MINNVARVGLGESILNSEIKNRPPPGEDARDALIGAGEEQDADDDHQNSGGDRNVARVF